jgi:hypothetical protein
MNGNNERAKMNPERITVPQEQIIAFCRKWNVVEFALFGSVLRDDFGPNSDIDVLLTFAPGSGITFDNRVEIQDELQALFGRKVDVVEKQAIRNPFRQQAILSTKKVLYAA